MSRMNALPRPDASRDGVYLVYGVPFARLSRSIRENFLITDLHDGPMPLEYNFWILRGASRTVLVDTGFGQEAARRRGRNLDVDPIDALRRLGVDPDEVTDVVITHLHYDHAGNMGGFARARFHVQEKEVAFATGRCMCEPFLRQPFDVDDIVTLVRHTFADRVCFHDGDAEPFPGVTLHHLPGHTFGIQVARVQTPRGPVVLASDVTHYYANILRRSPFVITVDADATLRSYKRLMSLADNQVDRIIPGHDPKVRDLFPTLELGGVTLVALHESAKPYDVEQLALRRP